MQRAWRVGAALGAGLGLVLMVGCGVPTSSLRPVGEGPAEADLQLNPVKALIMRDAKASFTAYDENRDGAITRAEAPFLKEATFEALDLNHDRKVTWQESAPKGSTLKLLLSTSTKALQSLFGKLDRNGNRRLEASERAAADYLPALPAEAGELDFAGFVRALDGAAEETFETTDRAIKSDRPPVVLVPGWFLPTAIWIPLSKRLKARGYVHQVTVPHWPSFGDIRDYAAAAAFRARKIQDQTGSRQVEVIGHSMGGLVLRYYLKHMDGAKVASHYISFGTPQHGTVIGKLWPCTSTEQMLPDSDFLKDLNAGDETPGAVKYTSIRTNTDEIVLSETSPILAGASNHLVPYAEHLELVWDPRAQKIALEALTK